MTRQAPKNVAASIHQRLLNIARNTDRPFNEVLQYFAIERFLYRLSVSQHAHAFVLKGALLFRIWDIPDTRATRDIDFLGFVVNTPEQLSQIVREVCGIEHLEDGLAFDADSVAATRIKEDADYEGVRVTFRANLGKARISMQVDVGFNDALHPSDVEADYPALLDLPSLSLRTYARETVVAEKAQAMVHLGSLNSRMKDFYDIWRLFRQFDFDGRTLGEAIRRTFDRRGTTVIEFEELAAELEENERMDKQWLAFLRKTQVDGPGSFADVLAETNNFLAPIFSSLRQGTRVDQLWTAPGPWRTS